MAKPSPEEMRLLAAEKIGRKELRTKLAKMLVGTKHPVDLVVMELIREAAQRAREFTYRSITASINFGGNTTARWQSLNESGKNENHHHNLAAVRIDRRVCRRRHQPSSPAPAKIRPGRPAPTAGTGTALAC